MAIFTYIGVGVVVGVIVGAVMGIIGNPPAWGVGAVAGTASTVLAWYVVQRTDGPGGGRSLE